MTLARAPARGATLAVSSGTFFLLGYVSAALGPLLPELAVRTGSPLAALGTVFTALFLGALLAQAAAGPLSERWGRRRLLLGGIVLLSAGLLGACAANALPWVLAAVFVAGLGHGTVNVSTNVLISEIFADRRVTALNTVNVFFGLGAVAGPALAGAAIQITGSGLPVLYAGAAALLALLPLAPHEPARGGLPHAVAGRGGLYGAPLLWALGGLGLLYVGAETGVGGWTASYMQSTVAMSAERAALVTSGFWLALTAGRMGAAWLGTRLVASAVLWAGIGCALAGGVLLAASTGQAALSTLAVLLVGFGFGPIFPTLVALVTSAFAGAPAKAAGVLISMGCIGGMLLPWLQGNLLASHGPTSGMLFVAALIAGMGALYAGTHALAAGRA